MWLLVVGVIVVVIAISLIGAALGYEIISKPASTMQEYKREREELANGWFSGKHRPDDDAIKFHV